MARTLGFVLFLSLWTALSFVGCRNVGGAASGEGDSGADADADSDADTDTDTDADTDTDSDSDSDSDVDDPNDDDDGDGYTPLEGDCDDDDPNVNPDAIEVIVDAPYADGGLPDPVDEDCDGTIDNPPGPCDEGIALEDVDPLNGARVIELCKTASLDGTDWGVVGAAYVRANGDAITNTSWPQIGVQTNFGTHVAPTNGYNLLVLSSGHARTPGQPESCDSQSCNEVGPGAAPPGFPQDVPGCEGGMNINDDVGFELALRAPSNAVGFRFKLRFYSFEYPEWVCTTFNDQLIALVDPEPDGSINGNVSFDSAGYPVSVNTLFITTCADCPDGTEDLEETGFDIWGDSGATSWIQTTVPIGGGDEFTIRFAIWDTGDAVVDSTALIDGFEWIAAAGAPAVETVPFVSE